jgi:hypothetical protein
MTAGRASVSCARKHSHTKSGIDDSLRGGKQMLNRVAAAYQLTSKGVKKDFMFLCKVAWPHTHDGMNDSSKEIE